MKVLKKTKEELAAIVSHYSVAHTPVKTAECQIQAMKEQRDTKRSMQAKTEL